MTKIIYPLQSLPLPHQSPANFHSVLVSHIYEASNHRGVHEQESDTSPFPQLSFLLLYACVYFLPGLVLAPTQLAGCNYTAVRPAAANSLPDAFQALHTLQDAVWR